MVGETTNLEKAVFIVVHKKVDEHNETVEKMLKTFNPLGLRNQVDVLRNLGWQFIHDRLNLNGTEIGIRDGYKIVKLEEKNKGIIRRSSITIIGGGGLPPGFPIPLPQNLAVIFYGT